MGILQFLGYDKDEYGDLVINREEALEEALEVTI